MVHRDVRVLVESDAGDGSSITDADYRAAGATIVADAADVWRDARPRREGEGAAAVGVRVPPTRPHAVHLPASRRVPRRGARAARRARDRRRVRDRATRQRPAPAARTDERSRGPHGAADRRALPRAPPRRSGRTARWRARRAARARRRARRGQRRLERGVDRAGHGSRSAAARQEPRPAALGRPDPQRPHPDPRQQPGGRRPGRAGRRSRDRRSAGSRRPRPGARSATR